MKKITKEELKTILDQHTLWLDSNKTESKCANLTMADLSGADLSGANLTGVNLTRANLTSANLSGVNLTSADLYGAKLNRADLSRADLSGADLSVANLSGANLSGADLSVAYLIEAKLSGVDLTNADLTGADLSDADLYRTDLTRANLTRANLTGAGLTGVNLRYANLTDTILDEKEQCRKGVMLTEPMTGYKKSNEGKIITLEIPIGAKVFSINKNKRRANKAKVIDMQGETELSSMYNTNFKYHVGDEIEITDFDDRYNVECSTGIHFFLTRKEAEKYNF